MSIQERFQSYADAFEETYVDDDWSRIEQFFTEDAVFEGDRIARLGGGMDPEAQRAMGEWMALHGAKL